MCHSSSARPPMRPSAAEEEDMALALALAGAGAALPALEDTIGASGLLELSLTLLATCSDTVEETAMEEVKEVAEGMEVADGKAVSEGVVVEARTASLFLSSLVPK